MKQEIPFADVFNPELPVWGEDRMVSGEPDNDIIDNDGDDDDDHDDDDFDDHADENGGYYDMIWY